MPPRPNPKYQAPKSHFAKRPPLTPAPAYTAPLQWTPPSSPAPPSMPLPTLPPYSTPELECPTSRSFPLGEPLSQPTLLPTFRANHPSPQPATPLATQGRRPLQLPQRWNTPRNQPPRCHLY